MVDKREEENGESRIAAVLTGNLSKEEHTEFSFSERY